MVLKGRERHELSCSSCGAPLHNLKKLPSAKVSDWSTKKKDTRKRSTGKSRKKKKKGLFSRTLDEAWDVLEDIFD